MGTIIFSNSDFSRNLDSTYLVGVYRNGEILGDTTMINPYRKSNPVFPQNNAVSIPPTITFKWSSNSEVLSYRLLISIDSTFIKIVFDYSNLIDTTKVIDSLSLNIKYYWCIETMSTYGKVSRSPVFSFTTVNSSSISNPLVPLNNSVNIPKAVELKWSKIQNAQSYELQISKDSVFKLINIDYNSLTDTVAAVDSLDYSSKYFWHIKTVSINGYSYWSEIWNFTLLNLPKDYQLYQNYPNPFNPATIIKYDLPQAGHVVLKVYDILGREVATLVNEEETAGTYTLKFNGAKLSSGVYFYNLRAGSYTNTKKLLLLK